ncbi:MAG: DUF3307 domain-containing protein [Bauldia sp.]|nr:DUF3307 domain-containing protein [Bauldia sp.]
MTDQEALILLALAYLAAKHFVFDFVFQRPYHFFRNKGIYGHPAGFIHSGLHVIGSIPALFILNAPVWAGVLVLAAEFVIHYHLDWGKEQIERRFQPAEATRFLFLGADQLGHQLTYIGMVAALVWAQ